MAHEIDMTSGRANMAYRGEVPWHGLGSKVDADATLEEWRRLGGLEWEALLTPVQYSTERGLQAHEERMVLYRSDTGTPLHIVSDHYKPVQPGEVLEFFRDLVEVDKVFKIETVGSLRGGRKVWALAKAEDQIILPGNDAVGRYLLMATSFDGSLPTIVMPTTVRVVCQNTLSLAGGPDGKKATVRVVHLQHFDAKQAKEDLGFTDAWKAFANLIPELAKAKMDDTDAGKFVVDSFWSKESPEREKEDFTQRYRRVLSDVMPLRRTAPGNRLPSADGTAWGVLNAVTYYVDHQAKRRSAENRLNSAWFGKGNTIKNRALATMTALVGGTK